jgi:hypothetical protein
MHTVISVLLAHRDDDALMANRRFRGIADMKKFSAPDDL